jgi:hypothetical protein
VSHETESSESENLEFTGENNVDCILYAKGTIRHELIPENQTANRSFYKQEIKRLIARVHGIRPESWYLLPDNAPARSSDAVPQF